MKELPSAERNTCSEIDSNSFSSLFEKCGGFGEKILETYDLDNFWIGEGSSRVRLHHLAIAQTKFYPTDFVILTVSKEHIPPVDLWVYAEDFKGGNIIEVSPFIHITLGRGARVRCE